MRNNICEYIPQNIQNSYYMKAEAIGHFQNIDNIPCL